MSVEIEIGTQLMNVRRYKSLHVGYIYSVKGCGDLTMIHGTNKKGPGFSIEVITYDKKKRDWWNHSNIKYYYFKNSEVNKYFVTGDAIDKQINRHTKITQLGL